MKTNLSWILLLLGFCLCVVGILGDDHRRRPGYGSRERNDHDDDHNDDDDDEKENPFWGATGGVVVLFFIGAVGCGLVSLVTWIACMCYKKANKMKVHDINVVRMSSRGSDAPVWSALLYYKNDIADTGFGDMSKGLTGVSANQLVRSRSGTSDTDGARWSAGIVSGKHVFEITWAWGHRGTDATVGVGTADVPLHKKGVCTLVGGCAHSWGLDIVRRRTMHNGKFLSVCPTDGSYVPDKFLMYVDMDNGTIGFGNDVTYWGQVITNLPIKSSTALYVMIGTCTPDAQIAISYKGSEGGEFATIASSYALPPVFGNVGPQKPPPYQEISSPKEKDSRPSSARSQVINVEGYLPRRDEKTGNEEPPPYCTPPPGYNPHV